MNIKYVPSNERFISTAYFRPTVKRGVILWTKK